VLFIVQMGYYRTPRVVQGLNRRISDFANIDPHLWVHDKTTGAMLAEIPLPQGGGPLVEELIAVGL
jgi:quinoprotein glucose dehydrogenase